MQSSRARDFSRPGAGDRARQGFAPILGKKFFMGTLRSIYSAHLGHFRFMQ
ncbi:hypothetical protein FD02_GL001993 [Lacticaseibacillus nasuensis JCM 17158]|uniref:Uncharacterized protein n=1 Tax=Lacticaseibacillus nasuensis JCM 17158 TaxID=1291734 RepID=A0A0R1JK54_9LACO|nr:hypothetical protein FD02_GL001993 [Lacticaseibacillus nasuensis JCM 17158]